MTRRWPRRRLALIGSWLAFLVTENLIWVRRTLLPAPPPWDPALYLFMSLRYWHALSERGLGALWREIQDSNLVPYVPPLFPLSALPLYFVFGESRLAAYATSSLYLCLLLAGTALLARGRHGAGAPLLALFLASTFSAPIRLSRDYHMDLPAAAWLGLGVWCLLQSEGFRRRPPSLAFGGCLGLALLTKSMSGPFFVAPALWALARPLPPRNERALVLRNLGLAMAMAVLIASAWWVAHSRGALWYLLYYGWGAGADPYTPSGTAGVFTGASLTYYLIALANQGASVPYLLLALVLGIEVARRRWPDPLPAADPVNGLLWSWLLAAYVVLTLPHNKTDDRYVVFLLPPLAALLARGVAGLRSHTWRRSAVAAIAIAGIANYTALTWPSAGISLLQWRPPFGLKAYHPGQAWLRSEIPVPEIGWPSAAVVEELSRAALVTKERLLPALLAEASADADQPEEQVRIAYRRLLHREPDPTGLRTYSQELRDGTRTRAQLLLSIATSDEFARRALRVLVVPDHPFLNASTLRYYAEASRARVTFTSMPPGRGEPGPLRDFDALVVKDGGYQGPAFSTVQVPWVESQLRSGGTGFRHVTTSFPCPDESEASVWLFNGKNGPAAQ